MRGDRPSSGRLYEWVRRFTPHARGSTSSLQQTFSLHHVYPACAGIDLMALLSNPLAVGLPRMRGDRPLFHRYTNVFPLFTPHARGSTGKSSSLFFCLLVYPACAGIDLKGMLLALETRRLPRMRGDRPARGHLAAFRD